MLGDVGFVVDVIVLGLELLSVQRKEWNPTMKIKGA
jgi:ABC-type transporter MlaC component